MLEIMKYLKARYMSEKAQGMTEYAVVLALVVIIAIAVYSGTGNSLQTTLTNIFDSISAKLQAAGVTAKS